jgi:hypothetical protein
LVSKFRHVQVRTTHVDSEAVLGTTVVARKVVRVGPVRIRRKTDGLVVNLNPSG